MDLAGTYCSGKLAMTLEGGYHAAGQRESVKAVLNELAKETMLTQGDLASLESGPPPPVVEEVIQVQRAYWPVK